MATKLGLYFDGSRYYIAHVDRMQSLPKEILTEDTIQNLLRINPEVEEPSEIPIPTLSPELQAIVDRQEFLEDCIAEMASVIYSTEGGSESVTHDETTTVESEV